MEQTATTETAPQTPGRHLAQLALGVSRRNGLVSIRQGHQRLSGEQLSLKDLETEMTRLKTGEIIKDYSSMPVDDFERHVSLSLLRQIFTEGDMQWTSVLRSWPMYKQLYETHVQHNGGLAPNSNVLLVGALSSVTASAFSALAETVYGTTRQHTHVVDLKTGADKRRHGTPVRGDVRHLPYQSSSMALVQSNHLFDQIGTQGWRSSKVSKLTDTIAAAHEAYRVLQPGGHLLLCESPIAYEFKSQLWQASPYNQERSEALRKMLEWLLPYEIGFTNVHVEPAFVPHGVHWLFDKTLEFDEQRFPRRIVPGALAVYAQKPLQPVAAVPQVLQ